ncbi:hypothetical protein PIB30_084273 [Stylosanthes scabra]|uniref:Uncharacterized protein n=1 Tax=Stylosanthes scabra TaxID=79078 RepID=A0ABU6XTL8_9FABA|nr:hypothetical protein [Stylosanthes scabra]
MLYACGAIVQGKAWGLQNTASGGTAAPCYLVGSAQCGQAHHADAPRPSLSARGMRAPHKRGTVAACSLVASAECGQAHRTGALRPLVGRTRRVGVP